MHLQLSPSHYPMPVEGLIYNPDFIAMPAAGVGILFRLCNSTSLRVKGQRAKFSGF